MLTSLRKKFGSLASASLLLMVSMTVVNAGNYIYNLIMGRWLGPSLFADVSLIVTLLLVVTFITAPLQLTIARFAALYTQESDLPVLAAIKRWLTGVALALGLLMAGLFIFGASSLAKFFNTASPVPFILFGFAIPFGLIQGVNRGILQGQTRFGTLAITYQMEMWSRLLLGLLLVWAGLSVNGAVLGISMSFIVTWLSTLSARRGLRSASTLSAETRKTVARFALPVLVSQTSQILINNSDILLVRHFYPSESAGLYAALALIGRIVFFATWSVVMTMFPIVTQHHKRGEPYKHLLWFSLGIVGAISAIIMLGAFFFPKAIIGVLFGEKYLSMAPLLWLYALATTLYALANVMVNYRLSLGMGRESGFAITAGIAQVVGIILFHSSLAQVVWVQVIIMGTLFVVLFVRHALVEYRAKGQIAVPFAHQ